MGMFTFEKNNVRNELQKYKIFECFYSQHFISTYVQIYCCTFYFVYFSCYVGRYVQYLYSCQSQVKMYNTTIEKKIL